MKTKEESVVSFPEKKTILQIILCILTLGILKENNALPACDCHSQVELNYYLFPRINKQKKTNNKQTEWILIREIHCVLTLGILKENNALPAWNSQPQIVLNITFDSTKTELVLQSVFHDDTLH